MLNLNNEYSSEELIRGMKHGIGQEMINHLILTLSENNSSSY